MIAYSNPVSERFEPLHASAAEAPWVGRELSPTQAVVRGKRILLVEDQELVRAALRMNLLSPPLFPPWRVTRWPSRQGDRLLPSCRRDGL